MGNYRKIYTKARLNNGCCVSTHPKGCSFTTPSSYKLNNLINEANAYSNYSSSWSPTTSSSKDIGKYDSISTGDWINTYINTTTSSPDGITWTSPYISTSSSSINANIDALEIQVNDLGIKNKKLENDIAMLRYEKEQLKAQNDDLSKRLQQVEAMVRMLIDNIEE